MKKIITVLMACLLSLAVTACEIGSPNGEGAGDGSSGTAKEGETADQNQKITELEQKISALEQEKRELQLTINRFEQEKQWFPTIGNLALQFVHAHIAGDAETLREMLGPDMALEERNGALYVTYSHEEQKVEWPVYSEDADRVYQDMLIQGFEYMPQDQTYRVHIREFFADRQQEIISPPTFLNLTFRQIDGEWKVVEISFDV
jgi:hypothetical protein